MHSNNLANHGFDLCDEYILRLFEFIQFLNNLMSFDWMECLKTFSFELTLKIKKPQSISNRCINIECLEGNFFTLLWVGMMRERSHIMQSIREFYKDDANIINHAKEHLSEAPNSSFFSLISKLWICELLHPCSDICNFISVDFSNHFRSDSSIFWNIMEETCLNSNKIWLDTRENLCSFYWVVDIRFS